MRKKKKSKTFSPTLLDFNFIFYSNTTCSYQVTLCFHDCICPPDEVILLPHHYSDKLLSIVENSVQAMSSAE